LQGVDEKIDVSRRHLHGVKQAIKNLRLTT
jgi:hypothetical protein